MCLFLFLHRKLNVINSLWRCALGSKYSAWGYLSFSDYTSTEVKASISAKDCDRASLGSNSLKISFEKRAQKIIQICHGEALALATGVNAGV